MVKRLSEFQFKAFPHAPRPEGFENFVEEQEWYSDDSQYTLGILFRDKIDDDWAYVLLQPASDLLYRAVQVESSFSGMGVAREKLIDAVDQAAQDFKMNGANRFRSKLPIPMSPIDPFELIVPEAKLNPVFQLVASLEGYEPAREMIKEVFSSYIYYDANFIEQFQTTGFDARIWELYLHAYLIDSGFSIQPSESPDFIVSRLGNTIAIEAVTANPTQGLNPANAREVYSSTGLLAPPFDRLIDKLDGRFEYKQEDFVPIKLGSALFSKLKKRYWTSNSIKDRPIILAIETFHDEASLHYSSSALSTYLYGYRHHHIYDNKGNLIVIPRKVDTHHFAGKSIPSGFFHQAESENISAVLFSNSGTVSKFNRMGQQGTYHNPRLTLIRIGTCCDPDPDSAVPLVFRYKVGDPNFREWWGQGLEMFHNPDALHPISNDLFPNIAHHRCRNGQVYTEAPFFQPIASTTLNLQPYAH